MFQYNERIETGITHVNSATVGGEAQMPFGGMKSTGVGGREAGNTAVEFFSAKSPSELERERRREEEQRRADEAHEQLAHAALSRLLEGRK